MVKCDFCGNETIQDEGHYTAKDEDKIMCIVCHKKIVLKEE